MSSLRNLFITVVAFELILLSFGCQKSERFSEGPKVALSFPLSDYYVSMSQAEQELNTIIAELTPQLKSSQRRSISNKFTISSKGTKAGEDPVIMHVFNFGDNDGYAIMAGDSRVPSLLCFVEKGQFAQENADNDLVKFIMSELTGMYRLARLLPDSLKYEVTPLEEAPFTKADVFYPVDTIYQDGKYYVYYNWVIDGQPHGECLSTEWDQGDPFNQHCPMYYDTFFHDSLRCAAGCAPIAVGQIMAYWQVTPPAPYNYLNWTFMSPILKYDSTPANLVGWGMVKTLIRRLGDSNNLDVTYGEQSGANPGNASRTFVNFGYTNGGSLVPYNQSSLSSSLSGGPALGRGEICRINNEGNIVYIGHTWVFDRYVHRKRPLMVYDSSWHPITGQMLTATLFHINWGGGGLFNGYFANSRFNRTEHMDDPLDPYIESTDTSYFYHYDLKMNIGIRP